MNTPFPNKKPPVIIKIIALLSLVRWYNVLLVNIALILCAVFLLNPSQSYELYLKDFRLYYEIIAISFLIQAGYIINAFYDYEKDIINRPKETLFGKLISKSTCLNTYVAFVLLGLWFSFLLGFKVFLFNFLFSFLLWYYSHRLRKINLLGEVTASVLTIMPFISLTLIYPYPNTTFAIYGGFIFLIVFTREIIKKMVSLKGDLIVGEHSIPIVLGIRNTKYIILFLMLCTMLLVLYFSPKIIDRPIFYYFTGVELTLAYSLWLLFKAKTPSDFDKINTVYKFIISSAIFSIVLILK